ncbi:MAG: hypothetical protein JNJ54_02495 [Myxococcaceae bacterium]|nr:hypothetical protein [Myxococcaceae bacterium]
MAVNRIDSTPARISTNFTVSKQTQGVDFGQRMQAGLANAGNALASGVGLLGNAIPGGGIVSAAISSVSNHIGGPSSGAYASTGMVNVGGGTGINTTVGGNTGGPMVGGAGPSPNFSAGVSANDVGMGNQAISGMSGEMSNMLRLQYQMQRENMTYTSISNVMKGKHDTVKNTIQNAR